MFIRTYIAERVVIPLLYYTVYPSCKRIYVYGVGQPCCREHHRLHIQLHNTILPTHKQSSFLIAAHVACSCTTSYCTAHIYTCS